MSPDGKLHADEFDIDEALVARLIADQFPEWSGLPLGKGRPGQRWALGFGLVAVHYYRDKGHVLAEVGARAVGEVLAEYGDGFGTVSTGAGLTNPTGAGATGTPLR
ncbi:hypothetical protein [Streptomyces ipomoeae]|uniref:hypothetical protein n=1 Tax=Streptomyces ipomoeae TaxID=103232 RepID=UPI0015F09FDE|nr:hypothetical protein [Streptomyces ipomoeae]MDX2939664.1 hypothetical protein [Streptomyces ipomoeae]